MYRTHGDAGRVAPEYKAWQQMKQRCYNPTYAHYEHYGGRGIAVCAKWLNSYEAFLADIGRRPSPQHSLDRINNDGNYEPGNVRWATTVQQLHNRRLSKKNTSGVLGVSWNKRRQRWIARVDVNGKAYQVGRFTKLEEAEAAVCIARCLLLALNN